MNKKARNLIFFLFLGLFLISAPVVVLYTAGFRLNPDRLALVKTGLFSVSSEPKGATVFIDGVPTEQKTNAIIKNIIPGEHVIRLEKTDFLPWEKKLEIKANETTFVSKVELFLDFEPTVKIATTYSVYALDETGEKIAFTSSTDGWVEIWSKLLLSGEEKILLRLSKTDFDEISLSWSLFDEETLIIKETKNSKVTWRSVTQDGQSEILSDNPALIWERDANQFLFVEEYGDLTRLAKRDQAGQEETLAIVPLGQYEFLPAPPSFVLLRDQTRGKIILIDDRGVDQPILLNAAALSVAWNPQNKKQLLYASDFELHVFDAENLTDELLTRLSTPIDGAAWHAVGQNIIFADDKNLFVIELDNRGGQRQIWTLATFDNIETFAPTDNGQTVYLIGTKNGTSAIFEQTLQK
ncbi:MAG: PEGA domain-containing protein [Patescibacteria group bacterium]|jgi:WD40 repeat protein